MSGRQRCFGIVRFGPYPDGADPTIIDNARFAALQALTEAQAAEGFEYLDQLGVGEAAGRGWSEDALAECEELLGWWNEDAAQAALVRELECGRRADDILKEARGG